MTDVRTGLVTGTPAVNSAVLEIRLRELSQLFDSMSPSPFRERDLSRNTEEYIVDRIKELPSRKSWALVIHFDHLTGLGNDEGTVGDAIRVHFARQANLLRRKRRELMHRGLISLVIGVAFLTAVFIIAHFVSRLSSGNAWARLLDQGLLIVGWVAMWRPLEIFLYDWWPILNEQRLYERLSRIAVQIVRP